ncbi:serine/threonine protein kinase [Candidatus Oscillochloris fontis]|uniref:serine/threonine protein kinase n=1 Tax=Candidatus Oscillochloris fontis TaxID=2496868 RepID=UPI00101CB405|nr:serine/threonine-protein kinase [Candidatus Oscillochloris fontis]
MFVPGTLINQRYEIVRQVGQGGMGAVYEATDTRLGHRVAIKQTLVNDPQYAHAFEREARLLAFLQHPGLPRVTDHFSDADGQFLVMDFIIGQDLADLFQQQAGAFPVATVLDWADQLLDALDYLHSQSPPVIHRDIKPQNLKLNPRGQLILLDFGLAKGALWQTRITSGGSVMGYTPAYAPMEQIQASGTDERSDLYAVGATLYHLLVGSPPPSALDRASALMKGQADPLVPAHQINPAIPVAVSEALHQAMHPDPNQRPASAVIMRAALQAASRQQPSRLPSGQLYTVSPPAAHVDARAAMPTPIANVATVGQPTILAPPPPLNPADWPIQMRSRWTLYHVGIFAVMAAILSYEVCSWTTFYLSMLVSLLMVYSLVDLWPVGGNWNTQ